MVDILETKNTNFVKFKMLVETSITQYFAYKYDYACMSDITIVLVQEGNTLNVHYINDMYHPGDKSLSIRKFMLYTYLKDNPQVQIFMENELKSYINDGILNVVSFSSSFNKYIANDDIKFVLFNVNIISNFTLINSNEHANIIIYDKNNQTFELFEPHGQSYDYANLKTLLELELQKEITLLTPIEYCPINGFQTMDERERLELEYEGFYGGFCQAWTLWYCDLRLFNYEKSQKSIINVAYKYFNKNKSFHKFIGNYSAFMFTLHKNILKYPTDNINNIIFNIVIRFFNMIKLKCLINNDIIDDYTLKLIIKNSDRERMQFIYNYIKTIDIPDFIESTYNNTSLRNAISTIIMDLDVGRKTALYKNLINKYYDHKYSDNILSLKDSKIKCPYDMVYIKNVIRSIDRNYIFTKRDEMCQYFINNIDKIPNTETTYLLLLLLLPHDPTLLLEDGYFNMIGIKKSLYTKEEFIKLIHYINNAQLIRLYQPQHK